MTIEKIVNYVLCTPHNTNKNILVEMLEQLIKESDPNTDTTIDIIYDGGVEKPSQQ